MWEGLEVCVGVCGCVCVCGSERFCAAGALRMRGVWWEMELTWGQTSYCKASCRGQGTATLQMSFETLCIPALSQLLSRDLDVTPERSVCSSIPPVSFMGPICKLGEVGKQILRGLFQL